MLLFGGLTMRGLTIFYKRPHLFSFVYVLVLSLFFLTGCAGGDGHGGEVLNGPPIKSEPLLNEKDLIQGVPEIENISIFPDVQETWDIANDAYRNAEGLVTRGEADKITKIHLVGEAGNNPKGWEIEFTTAEGGSGTLSTTYDTASQNASDSAV